MNSVQNCTLYSNAGGMMTMKRSNSSPSNSLESPTSTTTSTNDFMIFHPPPPPPPNSSSSDHHHHHNNNHLIDFQASPLLTFDHHRNYSSSSWDNYDHSGSWHDEDALTTTAAPPPRDATHVTTDHWLYPDPSPTPTTTTTTTTNATVTTTTRDSYKHNHKRPNSGESGQQHPQKKQPSTSKSTAKPAKPSSSPPSKDPQSIAAKNRRERISERLKVLQELVPNGSKVDLVTMLEKAISYVKFLQLQVKVLATDEFWPAQGGKAPDIAQVKEAIDAILSSSRSGSCRNNNKNSSNSSNSTFEGLGEEEEEEE